MRIPKMNPMMAAVEQLLVRGKLNRGDAVLSVFKARQVVDRMGAQNPISALECVGLIAAADTDKTTEATLFYQERVRDILYRVRDSEGPLASAALCTQAIEAATDVTFPAIRSAWVEDVCSLHRTGQHEAVEDVLKAASVSGDFAFQKCAEQARSHLAKSSLGASFQQQIMRVGS